LAVLEEPPPATIEQVGTVLIYLLVAVVVAAVVFLIASLVFGRGEELAALPPDATPTWLPEGRITGDDVRTIRFSQVLRGYRMSEVDWAMQRAADELDVLRARVAELEARR
jgi:DivIVA domain-containing protein